MKNFNFKQESKNVVDMAENAIAAKDEVKVQDCQDETVTLTGKKKRRRVQQAKPQTANSADAYRETYLTKYDKQEKHCAYINEEEFAYYADVVRVITHNEIPVGAYMSNILREHRLKHEENINNLYLQEHERMMACRSKK